MKIKKRLCLLILAAAMTLSLAVTASAASGWSNFQATIEITRAEVMTMADRMVNPSLRQKLNMATPTVKEILTNGYWRNYGVTIGTEAVIKFYTNGTYMLRYHSGSDQYGTYTLTSSGVLNISGYGVSNMAYDRTTGVFGRNVQVTLQGSKTTVDALTPISKADYDYFSSMRW